MLLIYVIFFIVTLPFFLILLLLKPIAPKFCHKVAQFFVIIGFKSSLISVGKKPIIIGKERVPKNTAVLYAANHRSLLDTPLAYSNLPTMTGFVAKKEIKKVPLLSWWMRLLHCFFLDRKDMRAGLKMVLYCIDNIKSGVSVYIAPEGTRTHEAEPQPFKEGSLKMADKTGCPIIPVAISGTDAVLENHWPWIKKGVMVLEFGDPIYPNELSPEDRKAMGAYTRGKIIEMLNEHKKYFK